MYKEVQTICNVLGPKWIVEVVEGKIISSKPTPNPGDFVRTKTSDSIFVGIFKEYDTVNDKNVYHSLYNVSTDQWYFNISTDLKTVI